MASVSPGPVRSPTLVARGALARMPSADAAFARRTLLAALILLGVGVGAAGLWYAHRVLVLVYASVVLTIGLYPIVQWIARRPLFGRRGLPRWAAVACVYAIAGVGLLLIGALVAPGFVTQVRELNRTLPDLLSEVQRALIRSGILERRVTMADVIRITGGTDATVAIGPLGGALIGMVGGLAAVAVAGVLTYYLLIDGPRLFASAVRLLRDDRRERIEQIGRDVSDRLSAWLRATAICGAVMGAASASGLALLGAPFFYVIAALAVLAEIVPIAGSLVTGVVATALAATTSTELAVEVALLFVVLHEIEANVLVPKVMERKLGMSPVVLLVALLVGAEWGGVTGVVLAVPTVAIGAAVVGAVRRTGESGEPARNRVS
jgi:predicted PurR-regulated permease PerM